MINETTARPKKAQLALIIRGDGLDFSAISQSLHLESTAIRRKGEAIAKMPPVTSPTDVWRHEIELTENEKLDHAMSQLLDTLLDQRDTVSRLVAQYSVALRLYVQSDRARIFYNLMPDTLTRLASIGLPLEVSVLSWGEI